MKATWEASKNTLLLVKWMPIFFLFCVSCSKGSDSAPAAPNATPVGGPLVWEMSSHPERSQWSSALIQIIEKYLSLLDSASDISQFCPTYRGLSGDQKINVWAEIFAATSYYESGWDPTASSVDSGNRSDKDTWSVGLLQLSVVDQKSYDLNFGDGFSDLQDPVKNLTLGVAIMAHQIQSYSRVLIPVGGSGLYWSTLHPGGKDDQSAKVIAVTKKLSFCQNSP